MMHKLQAFLDFVLAQYVKQGVGELDQAKLPHLLELKYRAVSDAAAELGGDGTNPRRVYRVSGASLRPAEYHPCV